MFWRRLEKFLFPPGSTTWIAILRIGLGLQIILYVFSLRGDWNYLFASENRGLINRDLTEAILNLESPFVPRLGWLVSIGHKLGFAEGPVLTLAWMGLLVAGLCLCLGLLSRPAAIVAWLLHLAARSSGGFITYGVDQFMIIGLFYLAIAPLPDRYSLDYMRGRRCRLESWRLGFHRRILQVHLCLIYFFGGLAKSLGAGWWDGTSLWRALTRPPFNLINPNLLLHWSYLLPVAGILICILELGYPLFIWPRLTRPFWLLATLVMHLAIGLLMGLQLFALIMIILNLAAFGPEVAQLSKLRLSASWKLAPHKRFDSAMARSHNCLVLRRSWCAK